MLIDIMIIYKESTGMWYMQEYTTKWLVWYITSPDSSPVACSHLVQKTAAPFSAIDPRLTISTREKRKVMASISGRSLVTYCSVHIYFFLAIIRPFLQLWKTNPEIFLYRRITQLIVNKNSQFEWIHKTSFFFFHSTSLQGNKEILQDHSK